MPKIIRSYRLFKNKKNAETMKKPWLKRIGILKIYSEETEDPEEPINSMALVFILTIPFDLISNFDEAFFTDMRDRYEYCSKQNPKFPNWKDSYSN